MSHKIAVYGTLKKDFGNYNWILKDKSHYLGEDKIKGFIMVSLGGFPALIPQQHMIDSGAIDEEFIKEYDATVQVFEVDDEVLQACDNLEGYPGWYDRLEVDTKYGKAKIYVMNNKEYLNKPIVNSGTW